MFAIFFSPMSLSSHFSVFSNYLTIIFPRVVSTCSLSISELQDLLCESHFIRRFGKSLHRK